MPRSFYDLMHISPHHSLDRFFTSWLLPPSVLLAYRLLVFLYCSLTIIIAFSLRASTAAQRFSYFTWLTYFGITFYNLFSVIHGFGYIRRGKSYLCSWSRPLQCAHSLYYTTIITLPFLVTIVYWAILFAGYDDSYTAWSNASVHALNSLFALLEILLPRTTSPPWLHIPFLILILAGYLAVAYITHATQGFYTYSFLDPQLHSNGIIAAYCIGILVGTTVVFVIVKGLVWGRRWVTEEKMGMRGKGVTGRDLADGEGWEMGRRGKGSV